MTGTTPRDDAALTAGLARWLARRVPAGQPTVTGLRRPSAGYSSETVMVDVTWAVDGAAGPGSLVIRMAPAGPGTFAHYDLTAQWQAQTAAQAAGVPVADPVLELDPDWLGAPFMAMPRVEGHIVGAVAIRDRWLAGLDHARQQRVHANQLAAICAVHRADPAGLTEVPRRDNRAEVAFWQEYLDWSSDGSPVAALTEGIEWCRRHLPESEPEPALLWGDARLENMVFGDDLAPLAVLDWDMTSIGAPEHDLAWLTTLDDTADRLFGERLAGFPDRDGTVALFEQLTGRDVSDLGWYETLAMVRSTAVMTRIGYLRRDAGQQLLLPIDDNPILDLLRARLR